jgi:hypothetical protein
MIKAKGLFWLNIQKLYKKSGQQGVLEKALAGLSPEDQAVFSRPILPVSWIDYGAVIRLLMALTGNDFNALRQGSRDAAMDNFKGIFKFFISLTSPGFFIKQTPLIWARYFDSGDVTMVWDNPHCVHMIVTNVEGMPKYHEHNIAPFAEEGMRLCGAKNIRSTHPKCLAFGDACCDFRFEWE